VAAVADEARLAAFEPAGWMDWLGRIACDRPRWMRALSDLETRLFEDELAAIEIRAPIWIAGLARSGSTILLELLARHPATATARYRDFPPVLTPILWDRLLARIPRPPEREAERAHADGLRVTAESPEAFEEPVWMAFFPDLHGPEGGDRLAASDAHPAFERFFRNHLRKLLFVRGRNRYLAKANDDVARLGYLHRLFPDARFVLPVRDPFWQIASSMKQHRLFAAAESRYPGASRHLARAGHFEFGLGRRPVAGTSRAAAAEIRALRAAGREAEAWAVQWAAIYGAVARELAADPGLAAAVAVLRYEDLVREPAATMERLLDHCRLAPMPSIAREAAERLRFPSYYSPELSTEERAAVAQRTAEVAAGFGYAPA